MSLVALLISQARQKPDFAAVFDGSALHASYGLWSARSAGLAKRLQGAGLQAMFERNRHE